MKNNKGITLIALIITIIVMLILVAVTVRIVVNSDLIGTAKGAKTDTEAAYADESNISGFNVTINGEERYFNNAEEYVDYLKGNGGAAGDDTTGGDDTEEGDEDNTVIIDPNGDHILHVFGQKYQIGDTTTYDELANCAVPITIVNDGSYASINGVYLWGLYDNCYLFDDAYNLKGVSPDTYWTEEDLEDPVVESIFTNIWIDAWDNDWITDKTVKTVAEVVAFEGFEANSVYLEEQLPN